MSEREYELAETQIEERDGATWVSGLCPACWERFAFLAPERVNDEHVCCDNGHPLHIGAWTTAGTTDEVRRSQPH